MPEVSSSLLWSIAIVAFYLGFIIFLSDLGRRFSTDAEITRKVVHIGTGNVILLAWWLNIPAWVGITAAVVAAIVAIISYFVPILPSINSVGRTSLGTFFYAVSMGVLVAVFWPLSMPWYAAIGILTMALGDGMAALVGQNFGRHPYTMWGNKKSFEGSLTMAGVSFLVTGFILLFVTGNSLSIWVIALIVAIVATLLETVSKLGVDNLTVPLGSAAIAFYLSQYWL
ncbi:MAG: Phytol kinase [Chroococcopsis gigantea SAG 12.99]|nr:phosphatidate cytidylyltransferase [Chlorogloea purpurea SAG 13.99]MDV3001288.1 Phytol kinase [Chroococcopsis gigantea SAG 12.99]